MATAIPISDEGDDDDDYGRSGPSLFAARGGGGEDALQIAPRRGGSGSGRDEQGRDLYSVVVVDKRNNNRGGELDGNGNEGGFFALNKNSPVVGGDGQALELASLPSSSSSGGGDSSVSSTSSGDTLVKQQQSSDIDPSALYVLSPFFFY